MNLQRIKFIEKLKDSDVARSDNDSDELESLVKDYPYFQSGRVLLAKEKFAHNALNVEKYIVEAAIHTTDRRLLKRYIEQEIETIEEDNNIITEEPIKGFTENQRSDTVEKGSDLDNSKAISQEDQSDEDRLIKEKIAKYRSALDDPSTDTTNDSTAPSNKDTSAPLIEEPRLKEESVIDLNTAIPQPTSQTAESEEPTSRIDRIISEVQQDMEDLKASKLRFQAIMNKLDGEENEKKSPTQIAKSKEKKNESNSQKKKPNKKKVSDKTTKKVNTNPRRKIPKQKLRKLKNLNQNNKIKK